MTTLPNVLRAITLNAVVEPGAFHGDGCRQLRLVHGRGVVDAWSWAPIPKAAHARIQKAVAYMIPIDRSRQPLYVVTRFDWAHTLDALSLVPEQSGTADDLVDRCRAVVETMTSIPLREFLSDVFSTPEVFYDYWTTPRRYRGAMGTLALEAVELAEALHTDRTIPPRDRDLAIAYALLRDLSKVWCFQEGWNNFAMGPPDVVVLSQIDGPLEHLRSQCPSLAKALRSLMLTDRTRVPEQQAQAVLKLLERLEVRRSLLDGMSIHPGALAKSLAPTDGGKLVGTNLLRFPDTPQPDHTSGDWRG